MRRVVGCFIFYCCLQGAEGQDNCTLDGGINVDCDSNPKRTALPTEQQYGGHNVTAITGTLSLYDQALTSIPSFGFDACPYTAATRLDLRGNDITTVGARAFAHLAALTELNLNHNAITWMAATLLDGLARLEWLFLNNNRLEEFDYGALAPMTVLRSLHLNNQDSGDLSCNGTDTWGSSANSYNDTAGIAAAVAACGLNPCSDGATGCPQPNGDDCTLFGANSDNVECKGGYTDVPSEAQWGTYNVTAITGFLEIYNQSLTSIPDDGFDACPYTAATALYLNENSITTVGARAFTNLGALTRLDLNMNDITWMVATSLYGLDQLTMLNLEWNYLGQFYFGALSAMTGLRTFALNIQTSTENFGFLGGTPNCTGTSEWTNNATGIATAVATCGASVSPCADCAVACPADDLGPNGECTCALFLTNNVDCTDIIGLTAVPTVYEYGNHNVTAITGTLDLSDQALTEIQNGGFDVCPYTFATTLNLEKNRITRVGARAFARLAALTWLNLDENAITWMAPTSLDGLTLLERLDLDDNRLGAFDYGALAPMAALGDLDLYDQRGGDLKCGGKDFWFSDAAGIAAAVASCGGNGSVCAGCAVACPADDPGPGPDGCSVCRVRSSGMACFGFDAVPTNDAWNGNDTAIDVTGTLEISYQNITIIPPNGFDACPHKNATYLWLTYNSITTVGAAAFATLSALTGLYLQHNTITLMAATSLEGLTQLTHLKLNFNNIGTFSYGALSILENLENLDLQNQDGSSNIGCNGTDNFIGDTMRARREMLPAISDAIASCNGSDYQCSDDAVACPASSSPPPAPDSGLSAGQVAGIVVGSLAGVTFLPYAYFVIIS